MRLREENKLKDKMEFQLETKHVFYLVLWSIVLSGAIFATGLFVGQKKNESLSAPASPALHHLAQKNQGTTQDPIQSSFTFLSSLSHHPEQRELQDAVLNAMAKLRLETLKKVQAQDEELKEELARKLFPKPGEADLADPERALDHSRGVQARAPYAQPRLGQAPSDLGAESEPEPEPEPVLPEPVPQAVARAEARAPVAEKQQSDHGDFAIQAKAFRNRDDAVVFLGYLKGELRRSKFRPFIMPVELPGKGKWFRVRIGKFGSRLEAEKFKEQFEKRLGLETFLVSL